MSQAPIQDTIFRILSFLLLLPAVSWAQPKEYDDTRRSTCMQAKNNFNQENPDIIAEANAYNKAARTVTLVKDPSTGQTVKQTYPEDDASYRRACEAANGIFVKFTGILDCQTNQGLTDVSIFKKQAHCYPPVDECAYYTIEESIQRGDLQLDTERMFGNQCTLRENSFGNTENAITYSTQPLPQGKARFQYSDPGYSISKRETCMDAIKKSVNGYLFGDAHRDKSRDALNTARIDEVHHERIETIAETPVLTQVISHPNWDDNLPASYQDLCQQSGGLYSNFTGVLDCIGLGVESNTPKGARSTTLIHDAANCFPATGCEGYTMERWKLDTLRYQMGLSCAVREGTATPTTSSSDGDGGTALGLALVLAVLLAISIAMVAVHRQRQQRRRILETGPSSSYSDNDGGALDGEDDFRVELPSIS